MWCDLLLFFIQQQKENTENVKIEFNALQIKSHDITRHVYNRQNEEEKEKQTVTKTTRNKYTHTHTHTKTIQKSTS